MIFFDAHAHCLKAQTGGFLIGLEGRPSFAGTLNNQQAQATERKSQMLFAVTYVRSDTPALESTLVKYHPRREKYTPEFVSNDIANRSPKICIIDTLNEPDWTPGDYWQIARKHPTVQFLFAHAGGFQILEFVKMCTFTPNVWLDFSLTQEYFGCVGTRPRLSFVADIMNYAVNSSSHTRILFGSDEPFFSQKLALPWYQAQLNGRAILAENFLRLVEIARLV